ncbi:MAG: anhydro-N-acetylmuramic acid kinase [candidate division Zixibacteria bacterium]|nr:anhydro-N-acetylmuramic acid kinase [candidate division Zixibacteria bacterium]
MSNKKNKIVIGINSGTSIDSLDIGFFSILYSKSRYKIESFDQFSYKIPQRLHKVLWDLASGKIDGIDDLLMADKELAVFIGKKTVLSIKKCKIKPEDIALLGSHGQTVRHIPSKKVTLQIGDPSMIAVQTGITTVGDFRRADIGAGGEGAPLSPIFHKFLFEGKSPLAVVNIGGISNISYLPENSNTGKPFGFDCGPGNIIIDWLVQKYFARQYDNNGAIGRRGKIIDSILEKLLKDRFLSSPPPKSSGREYYGENFVLKYFKNKYEKCDLVTTATEYTAMAISSSIRNYLPEVSKLILCGGGALNQFLIRRIEANIPDVVVETSNVHGLHPKSVECAGFALLAVMAFDNIKSDLRRTTGAKSPNILGKICYA